jgi:hypothetical protein
MVIRAGLASRIFELNGSSPSSRAAPNGEAPAKASSELGGVGARSTTGAKAAAGAAGGASTIGVRRISKRPPARRETLARVIRTASAQHALGHLALAGLDQGGEQAGTGHAFGQAAGLAHQRPPDRIGGQQAAVGGGQRRRFAQGLDEAFRLVGVIARSGRAA